ncbi:MAG: hypothetical protein KGL39_43150 [Patescibacteria group bacterium]|nr:hypothetical protein [Patescibacteria group bacterium]
MEAELVERKRIIDHFRYEVDFDDPNQMAEEAWSLLDRGLTLGIFQVEAGAGAKRLVRQIAPRSIEDAAVYCALNKPGPTRSGDTARYIKRRRGEEAVTYPHEILENILKPTYGVFVFQEQVIAYFSAIGYSLSEADHIRKIVGKKLPEEMEAEYPRYLERAEKFMSKQTAQQIWSLIVNFSKYGFNKAHAVAYATLMTWTVYCKWKWSVYFYMASIETVDDKEKIGAFVEEARRAGISVLPPDVNRSKEQISEVDGGIIYGFADIKGIKSAAELVVEGQPYASPHDFIERCQANAGVKKALSAAGALDTFGHRIANCEQCKGKGRVPQMVPKKNGDGEKKVLVDCDGCAATGWALVDIPSKEERAKVELDLLGVALTDKYEDLVRSAQTDIQGLEPVLAADTEEEIERLDVVGIIKGVTKTKVKNGKTAGREMAMVTLTWENADVKFACFPGQWERLGWALKEGTLGRFTVKTGPRGGQILGAEPIAR